MNSEPTYRTGDLILEGDTVRFGVWDGVVESIITSQSPGWVDYWKDVGEGVLLAGPEFGRLHAKFDDDELVFVRRKQP